MTGGAAGSGTAAGMTGGAAGSGTAAGVAGGAAASGAAAGVVEGVASSAGAAATSGSTLSGTGRAARRRVVRSTRGTVRSARGAAGSMGGVAILGSAMDGVGSAAKPGVVSGAAGMGAETVRGTLSMRSSLDGAPLGATAQTFFANGIAVATGSVTELLNRKVLLPAAARIPAVAIQKRTRGESPRLATARAEIDSRAPSAGLSGDCFFASSTGTTTSGARATGAIARSVCRADDLGRDSFRPCNRCFGFFPLAEVLSSSSSPAEVNQQKSEDGDVSALFDGGVVIISA